MVEPPSDVLFCGDADWSKSFVCREYRDLLVVLELFQECTLEGGEV